MHVDLYRTLHCFLAHIVFVVLSSISNLKKCRKEIVYSLLLLKNEAIVKIERLQIGKGLSSAFHSSNNEIRYFQYYAESKIYLK